MSHLSMILSAVTLIALSIYLAPSIFALNRGHVLRNVALWMAIFLGLAVIYQNFGPGSPHQLFSMPDSMAGMNKGEALKLKLPSDTDKNGSWDKDSTGEQGFTPPKE